MRMHSELGIVTLRSSLPIDETMAKLKAAIQAKGLTVFAVVDHSGEARKAGLEMPETKLFIFGSPAAGTPIMLAAPTAAIDLPMKMLIAEDGAGAVWVSYSTTGYLQARHGFPPELEAGIAGVAALAQMITNAAP